MFDLAAGPVVSVDGEDIREPGRDRPLDTWRVARSEACRRLVEEIHGLLHAHERAHQPRQRARRPRDAEAVRGMVEAIVCDLVHLHLTRPDGRLAVSLDKGSLGRRSRYRNPSFGRPLPRLLGMMAAPELGFIALEKGLWLGSAVPGSQTTIRPVGRLIERIEGYGLTLNGLGREATEEVIILKSGREDFWDSSEPVEYEDTPAIRAMRRRVQAINAFLAGADIEFHPSSPKIALVDIADRRLRRYFNQAPPRDGHPAPDPFRRGGRLFGGFWQPLKKVKRHEGIRIEGERVVTLDYGQMNPRLLYARIGQPVPQADAYDIPGFREHRAGIKKVFNAALFTEKPLARMPKGTVAMFPRRPRIGRVIEAILSVHPALAGHLFTGVGFELMFEESEILLDVLEALMDEGIVALPVHDAVVVRHSAADRTEAVMRQKFRDRTGMEAVVSREGD